MMQHPSDIPVINIPMGPGSQESDAEGGLDYMRMPSEMSTYDMPIMPETEELQQCPQTLNLLDQLQSALTEYRVGGATRKLDLAGLPERGVELLNQILGEGEVSLMVNAEQQQVKAQESVLAGVWRLHYSAVDGRSAEQIEIADIPAVVAEAAFRNARPLLADQFDWPPGVLNAPSVLVELQHKSQCYQPGEPPHVVNLSLLPFSPADHAVLNERLGAGEVVILSRGYGNCRISSTLSDFIWRVQYFNSTDQLILDTLEVVDIPAVACAAQEDLEDSADRLYQIREILE